MAKARGLGKGFNPYGIDDQSAGVPQPGDTLDDTRGGIRSLIGSGDDFAPYTVNQADEYFQGPTSSTRVQAHQFIPTIDIEEYQRKYSNQLFDQLPGYIYVRFWKKNTLWQYGPCTLRDYRTFRESASKGRSVRSLESFGHGPGVQVPGLAI